LRRAFCLSNRCRSTPWWPVPQICGRLQAQLCEVHKWGICGDDSFRNWGIYLLSMRSDSPIEIVRFRRDALLGVIRRREWMMFLWVLTHCLPAIYRKSRDPYLYNCEATANRGRKVFEVYCDNSHAGYALRQ
jgi:hypothetical protein